MSVFEDVAELIAEESIWTEKKEVMGVWRKLHYEEQIYTFHQRTVSIHSP
jgi:hypothetical protein